MAEDDVFMIAIDMARCSTFSRMISLAQVIIT